jgi:hypothetical protein
MAKAVARVGGDRHRDAQRVAAANSSVGYATRRPTGAGAAHAHC